MKTFYHAIARSNYLKQPKTLFASRRSKACMIISVALFVSKSVDLKLVDIVCKASETRGNLDPLLPASTSKMADKRYKG